MKKIKEGNLIQIKNYILEKSKLELELIKLKE